MLFNEIEKFIEVYNNSVIELVQCFGTSLFGRIDHLARSVINSDQRTRVTQSSGIRQDVYIRCRYVADTLQDTSDIRQKYVTHALLIRYNGPDGGITQ